MDESEVLQASGNETAALPPLHAEPPPLRLDEGGIVRVGKSRVSLDLVVEQYENGMAPEDMVRAYDTLALADVYGAIAYYLRRREEVRAYVKRRAEEAEALRAKIEAERPRITREELLARQLDVEPEDEWERGLFESAIDCGVSVPDSALSSDGLYE